MAASGTGTAYVIINGGNFRDARIKGEGDECYLFGDATASGHHFDDTTAFTSGVVDVRHCDRLGLQLVTENEVTDVVIGADDSSVDAASTTFVLPGFDFTDALGATLHIEGAANAGNDGDFVITTVTDAETVICADAVGLVDEVFDPETVTITVERTDDPLTGDWTIDLSNDYTPASTGTAYGQVGGAAGKWTPVTALFNPAIEAVAAASSQYAQMDLRARSLRVTFTPTAS